MTAASSRTPRTYEPRHSLTINRILAAGHSERMVRARLAVRVFGNWRNGIPSPRHAADEHTPSGFTVAAIVERVR